MASNGDEGPSIERLMADVPNGVRGNQMQALENVKTSDSSVADAERAYESPRLVDYGTLSEVTRGGGENPSDDATLGLS